MSSTSTKDDVRLQSRQLEATTEHNDASATATVPSGPIWNRVYWSTTPEARLKLLRQAEADGGLLSLTKLPALTRTGRVPPAQPSLLDWLNGAPCDPSEQFGPLLMDADAGDLGKFADSDRMLTPNQRLCVERILACQDVFLLRGLPATGSESVLRAVFRATALNQERVLVVGTSPQELAEVLESLANDVELFPVFVPPNKSLLDPDELLHAYLPGVKEQAEHSGQISKAARNHAAQVEQIAVTHRHLEAARGWEAQLPIWRAEFEHAASIRRQQASLRSALEAELNQAHVSASQEWLRHWAMALARHQTARQELEDLLAKTESELAATTSELDRRRRELATQEALARSLRFPNPFSGKWWRALFQGRRTERLAEARARVQDAEIRHMAARSHLQQAAENLEVESRRHVLAMEQILRNEESRCQAALQAALDQETRKLESRLEQWQAWEPVRQAGLPCAALPNEATLAAIRERLEASLADLHSAVSHLPPPPELSTEMAYQISIRRANVVATLTDALTSPKDAADWLALDYSRVIVLSAHRVEAEVLTAAATWGKRLILVGSLRSDGSSSRFDELWNRCRPRPEQQAMQWLRSGDRWHSRWMGLTSDLLTQVHREALLDQPHIDLFIVEPPGRAPRVAALEFLTTKFSLSEAKRFCQEELGDTSIDPISTTMFLQEDAEALQVSFGAVPCAFQECIELEGGIKATMVPTGMCSGAASEDWQVWRTARLVFARQDWNWHLVREWLCERGVWFDPMHTHELTEVNDVPAAAAEALACLDAEGNYSFAHPQQGHRLGQLVWLPMNADCMPKPSSGGALRRMERTGRPEPKRLPPQFNVAEAHLAVAAGQVLIKQVHGPSLPKLHFQARTATQLQMLRQQWQEQNLRACLPKATFAIDGVSTPPRCDVLIYSLWQPTRAADFRLRHQYLADVFLAVRQDVCLIGPLEHLDVDEGQVNDGLSTDRWLAFLQLVRAARRDLASLSATAGAAA